MCQPTGDFVLIQVAAFPPGGFADVFLMDERAFKLYKNHRHPQVPPERGEAEDELRRLAFDAERTAYEIASKNEELKKFYS